jgi:hypothetical protein
MMAMPMVMIMASTVVGMLGVMRCLRNLMRTLVVDCLRLLYVGYLARTRRCLRNLIGPLVVDCLCLLYLDYFVLTRFRVWLRTRHVGLLAGDDALRKNRGRRKRDCYCQSGSQNFLHARRPKAARNRFQRLDNTRRLRLVMREMLEQSAK